LKFIPKGGGKLVFCGFDGEIIYVVVSSIAWEEDV